MARPSDRNDLPKDRGTIPSAARSSPPAVPFRLPPARIARHIPETAASRACIQASRRSPNCSRWRPSIDSLPAAATGRRVASCPWLSDPFWSVREDRLQPSCHPKGPDFPGFFGLLEPGAARIAGSVVAGGPGTPRAWRSANFQTARGRKYRAIFAGPYSFEPVLNHASLILLGAGTAFAARILGRTADGQRKESARRGRGGKARRRRRRRRCAEEALWQKIPFDRGRRRARSCPCNR